MVDVDLDQRLRDIQGEYLNFLDDSEDQGIYTQLVQDMINKNERRLVININDLRRKKPERVQSLLNKGVDEITAFQRAVKEFVGTADPSYAKKHEEFYVGFEGSFGSKHVTARTLSARHLGSLVCVEGIVTKCSLVRPKVVRSVHYCPATKKTTERRYTDLTSFNAYPSTAVYPTKDDDGNLLETEYGLSVYKDHQTLTIQELPEMAPAGQLPRAVDTICDDDLVDQCKPGDRVQIVGIYRCLPGKQGGFTTGTFRTVLIACSIVQMSKEAVPIIFRDDVVKCKNFSKQKGDVFELLAKSLAPSIHGHEYIKKALLCMLLGGVEKVLPNGTRLRGDINILLIGDPSVAKSQLLRYVLFTAPRAIATTGRGASGVGLTAAVTTDHETGDRRLEAGAMVLADRGVVCIDEFDKMSDIDRTAIHEVMEQGRVTISKAGIHARLNARCSVLAAANPVYGRYDQYKTPMENIGLQDSLLSRFDLLFIVLDTADPESDARIADHVVRMHRYRTPGEQDGEALPMGQSDEKFSTNTQKDESEMDTDTPIFEKYDPLLHGNLRSKKDKIVSIAFMKKYIYLAHHMKPVLTRDAADCIAEEYSRLRSQDNENTDVVRTQPVTARALETLIRLSTAHAKSRLSKSVDLEDAQAAIQLVQFAYFKKVLEKEKKKKRHLSSDEEEEEEEGTTQESQSKRRRRKSGSQERGSSQPKKKPGDEGYDVYDFEEDTEDITGKRRSTRKTQPDSSAATDSMPTDSEGSTPILTTERFNQFKSGLLQIFRSEHANSMPVSKLREFLNREYKDPEFSDAEVNQAFAKMEDANQVMVADEIVFLI